LWFNDTSFLAEPPTAKVAGGFEIKFQFFDRQAGPREHAHWFKYVLGDEFNLNEDDE
jgi:hypothetical protein